MEFINKSDIKKLINPGVISEQLLNPENSRSERITITSVTVEPKGIQPRHKHDTSEQIWICVEGEGVLLLDNNEEKKINAGDVVRFADKDVHGLRNDTAHVLKYISVTSPPINFSNAYKIKK